MSKLISFIAKKKIFLPKLMQNKFAKLIRKLITLGILIFIAPRREIS